MEPILHVCNGTYRRLPDGAWCYFWGAAVPGARDLTLGEVLVTDPGAHVGEIAASFRTLRAAERAWLAGEQTGTAGVAVRRRGTLPPHAGDLILGLLAPELHVQALMTVADVARVAGVSKATVDSYRYRDELPPPQATSGRTPLWSRPVVRHWLASRGEAGHAGPTAASEALSLTS